jgi:hypothetical protein
MATAAEMAARLAAMSEEVVRATNASKGRALSALTEAFGALAAAKTACEEPTSEVAYMLGEEHQGTLAIVGSTSLVSDVLESAAAATQRAMNLLVEIPPTIDNLGFQYIITAGDIRRAGGR